MARTKSVLAWHFVGDALRGGAPIPADGEVLAVRGKIVPCENGLHASVRLIDALSYAPGNTLCRVECSGTMRHERDKLAASKRRILWRIDAESVLREFARKCALQVAHLWEMPAVVRQFLETGDESIRAAASAAARAAVLAAVWDAASAPARAAVWAASSDAVWAAASAAARDVQNDLLTALVEAARAKESP